MNGVSTREQCAHADIKVIDVIDHKCMPVSEIHLQSEATGRVHIFLLPPELANQIRAWIDSEAAQAAVEAIHEDCVAPGDGCFLVAE